MQAEPQVFAALGALGDRVCALAHDDAHGSDMVWGDTNRTKRFSVQDMLSCDLTDKNGCHGERLRFQLHFKYAGAKSGC